MRLLYVEESGSVRTACQPVRIEKMKSLGFSLTEVLIALFLVSVTTLSLLQQQLQSHHQLQQTLERCKHWQEKENFLEERS